VDDELTRSARAPVEIVTQLPEVGLRPSPFLLDGIAGRSRSSSMRLTGTES